jgi:hypothetical protein
MNEVRDCPQRMYCIESENPTTLRFLYEMSYKTGPTLKRGVNLQEGLGDKH